MTRVVVAIDPAVTSGEEADETSIVVAGTDKNGHGYVLADLSGRYPPTEWAPTCREPWVKGLTIMTNSIYNEWRMVDVWLDK